MPPSDPGGAGPLSAVSCGAPDDCFAVGLTDYYSSSHNSIALHGTP